MNRRKKLKILIKKYLRNFKARFSVKPFRLGNLDTFRLSLLPRKQLTSAKLNKHKIWLTDPYWFILNHQEIFEEEIYKFIPKRPDPFILDCGSNIGLSIIYFKHLYPEAQIVGFEPDPNIFEVLTQNLRAYNFQDVELLQKAVWVNETVLLFHQDGSLGGKIVDTSSDSNVIEVQATRLKEYLNQPIDFLKIDIEGAEYDVLVDCKEKLDCVDYLFVEYHGQTNETQKLHTILEIISSAGFRYHIKEANPVHHPFIADERGRTYDLQLNIFGFRD